MPNQRKQASKKVREVYNKVLGGEGDFEFVDEETFENRIGLTHTNVSIVQVPEDTPIRQLQTFTSELSEFGFITDISEEDDGVVVHVMYSYEVIDNLGLVDE